MASKYALVLGGTGFISSFCVDELLNAGFNVTILTRGRTKSIHGDKVHASIVAQLNSRSIVSVLESSLMTSLNQQCSENKIDTTNLPEKWDLVIDCICYDEAHAKGVVKGLVNRTKLLVHISTDSIYEVCEPAPQELLLGAGTPEEYDKKMRNMTDNELTELDGYGFRKWQAEQVYKAAARDLGFPVVMLRLPDVLGEREFPRSRHFQYQIKIMLGLPIYLNDTSNGTAGNYSQLDPTSKEDRNAVQRMSFVHAADVGRAAIAFYRLTTEQNKSMEWLRQNVYGHGFNLGSKENITMREYLALTADELNTLFNGSVKFEPYTFYDHEDWRRMFANREKMGNNLKSYSELSRLYYEVAKPTIRLSPRNSDTSDLTERFWSQQLSKIMKQIRLKKNGTQLDFSMSELLRILHKRPLIESGDSNSVAFDAKCETKSNSIVSTPFATPHLQTPSELSATLKSIHVYAPEYDSSESSSSSSSSSASSSDSGDSDPVRLYHKEFSVDHTGPDSDDEDDLDRCTYLPSVNRGPIDVTKISETLACVGWKPTPLHEWLRAMTRWYAYAAFAEHAIMGSDPGYRIRAGVIKRAVLHEIYKQRESSKMSAGGSTADQ